MEEQFEDALQYTRKDAIKTSLNSSCPQSTTTGSMPWHELTLTIGDKSMKVLDCMQSGNTIRWTSLDVIGCNKEIKGAKIKIHGKLDYSRLTPMAHDYTNELTDKTRSLSSDYRYYTFVIVLQEGATVNSTIINKHCGYNSKTLVINGVDKIVNNGHGVVGFRGDGLGFDTEVNLIDIKSATLISYKM